MGALSLAIFILTCLRAADGFAQTPNKRPERLSVQQQLALQERNTAPALAQVSTKADGSPYRDPADENQSIALPSWSSVEAISNPDLILSNKAPCSPVIHPTTTGGKLKRRGVKERREATPKSELFCPLPATTTTTITTTDTDSHPSKTDGRRSQTEKGEEQGPAPNDELLQLEEFKWPNMFKIPTDDGDSPACFEATNSLMPIGVCENPEQQPEPSRWDVFMQFNRYMDARAWKLLDSTLAWPGMRECVPHNDRGIWCCRFYTVLIDGSGFGDICWPLTEIEQLNQEGQGPWQQYMNPLLPRL